MNKIIGYLKTHEILTASIAVALAIALGFCISSTVNNTILAPHTGQTEMVTEVVEETEAVRRYMESRELIARPEMFIAVEENPEEEETQAKLITYIADGITAKVYCMEDTVGELFGLAGVNIDATDRLEKMAYSWSTAPEEVLTPESSLEDGMVINVVRVDSEYIQKEVTVAYTTTYRDNNTMDKGTTKVVQQGSNGKTIETYKVVRENGEVVSTEKVSSQVVSYPTNAIVDVGTVPVFYASNGTKVRYSKKIRVKLTCYTASYEDTGKLPDHPEFGITYSGYKARIGIVACDPKYIPLNTNLYVTIDGQKDYGFCWTGDIGSGVKENHLDLYVNTQAESDGFGVKYGYAYVLYNQTGYPF